MLEVKQSFLAGLNLDDSFFSLRKDNYVDALNITRDAVAGSQDLAITNIVGNRIVSFTYPAGRGRILPQIYPNTVRGTAIFFRWNENGFHGIYQVTIATRTIVKIFENLTDSDNVDILGFTEFGEITSVNIYNREEGDLLYFLDTLGRPTGLNITRFLAGEYIPVTRAIIDVAVVWPYQPPTCVYDNDATKQVNYLINKLFKFQYIWCFDDFYQSVGSPESATPLPANVLDPTFTNISTNNNVIRVQLSSGGKNVKAVKLLMSYAYKENVWRDFAEVITIDKAKEGIADDINFIYSFYNDSVYPFFDLARRIQLQDYVPQLAVAQEMPNGNVLTYVGITEGYDNDLVPNVTLTINTVAAGNGGIVGSLNAISTFILHTSGQDDWKTVFSGVPAVGTVVTITLKRKSDSAIITMGTYTTVSGDSSDDVAEGMRLSMIALGKIIIQSFPVPSPARSGSTLRWTWSTNTYDFPLSTNVVPPTTSADDNSIATWPFFSQRSIGLVYFDEKGRTNGVVYNAQVIFPNYAENGTQQVLLPFINAKIYHVPPDWAYSFSWAVTKDDSDFLYFETIDVNTTETDYLYFEITNMGLNQTKNPTVAAVVNWQFQDGDRMRLIRRMSDGFVYGPTFNIGVEGIVVSPIINNVTQTDKTFVKVKKVAPFAAEVYTSKFFVIQLYRINQTQPGGDNKVFFEFGETYPILNPTTSIRVHAGSVTNQSTDYVTPAEFNFYNGDAYFRARTVYLSQTGFGTFNVQDKNFVDFEISAVNSLDGRPNAIDPNAKRTYYPTLIRYSQEYEAGTNINGLNRFLAANFDQYPETFGAVIRLKCKDKYMRVFQELKTGVVYLFSKLGKSPNGDEVLVSTDTLLNPIQYYAWEGGIGNAGASLATFNYADYIADNKRGVILRVSLDGVIPISIKYKVNSWATDHLPLRMGQLNKIIGAFDPKASNYIMALEATTTKGYLIHRTSGPIMTVRYTDVNGEIAQQSIMAPEHNINVIAQENSVSIIFGVGTITETFSNIDDPYTLTFDEETNAFESFLSYHPESMGTIGTLLITGKSGEIYTHDSPTYNRFYDSDYESNFTPVFNEFAIEKKTWQSISQNANVIWECPSIYTNVNSYGTQRQETNLVEAEFRVLEGMPSSAIKRDANSRGGKINGGTMKGNFLAVKFRRIVASELIYLSSAVVKAVDSPLTPK